MQVILKSSSIHPNGKQTVTYGSRGHERGMDGCVIKRDGWMNWDYNILEGIYKKTICTYDMCIGKEGRCC